MKRKISFFEKIVMVLSLSALLSVAHAEYDVKSVSVLSVKISPSNAIVYVTEDSIPNNQLCTNPLSSGTIGLDLKSSQHANFLYTQLMTALVSEKKVNLSFDGCMTWDEQGSLPKIVSVEVVK